MKEIIIAAAVLIMAASLIYLDGAVSTIIAIVCIFAAAFAGEISTYIRKASK